MKNELVSLAGKKLNYKIYGSGKPVLLIHGFGEDSSIWNGFIQSFSGDNIQLIIPDLPGTGDSSLLQKEHPQISDYADAIKAILDEEKIRQCVIAGHSMGGYISLAFAEKYPDMISALGLIHSGAYADDEAKIDTRKKGIKFIRENGVAAFLKRSTPGLFFDVEKSKDDINSLLEKATSFTAEALIQYYEAMIGRPDTTAVLKTIDTPVLFIIGEYDKAIPFPHSLQQSHMPQNAVIRIMRDSAHMSMLEEVALFNTFLGEFLQSA